MGDISTEPSMEEILSSIKRIIAEEGDAATGARSRRAPKAASAPKPDPIDVDEVLELSEPVAEESAPEAAPDARPQPEAILSPQTVAAMRGPLEALSHMVVKPEAPAADNTLEGLVRELLRPMLREWLDANLPQIVEELVAREIARITARQG